MLLSITVEGKLPYPAHIYILFYNEMISNPTCYISFICAFYHVCSSYRFYVVAALPPLMQHIHYFHTMAGFRRRKTAVKNSYYKNNYYVHRKTHLITRNGFPFITFIYICHIHYTLVWFGLVYLFVHSVTYVTMDTSSTDYSLQHNLYVHPHNEI